jgi:hypothetical protein
VQLINIVCIDSLVHLIRHSEKLQSVSENSRKQQFINQQPLPGQQNHFRVKKTGTGSARLPPEPARRSGLCEA